MKYAITLASFRKIEPIENTLAVLTKQGYDAVEMFGEPTEIHTKKLLDSLKSYDLSVCGVTGMWGSISRNGWKRRLVSSDTSLVKTAEQYVIDCLKLCNILGGHEMNVCLFADEIKGVDSTHSIISSNEKELFVAKAVPIMKGLCKKAQEYGVQLLLEPLNRYSTPFCATAKDALEITQQVESLGVLLDTFHMNIEEDFFKEAIQSSRKTLRHMHFADNNRKMPGLAHIDFPTIVKSLKGIDYDGFISFEPNIADKNYVYAIKYGLDYVKRMVKALN